MYLFDMNLKRFLEACHAVVADVERWLYRADGHPAYAQIGALKE